MHRVDLDTPPDYVEKKGNWELRIYYRAKGTKSEGSHGILLFNNKPIFPNYVGDEIDTDLGLMKYYGESEDDIKYIWDPSGWNYADKTKIKHSWDIDKITLKGILTLNFIEGVHYILKCKDGNRYVLFGNLTGINKFINSQIEITGFVIEDSVDIYMDGIPFNVISFREVDQSPCDYND